MRLKQIKKTLEEIIPELQVNVNQTVINNTKYTSLDNLKSFRRVVLKLIANNIFFDRATELLATPITQFDNDVMHLDPSVAKPIVQNIDSLKNAAIELNNILGELVGPINDNSVFIKLSEINDLSDLAASTEAFNKIFSQLILDKEIGGHIKIEEVESGSIWLEIGVGTAKALALISSIAFSAALAYRELAKARYIDERRRTLKIKNDNLDDLKKAQKIMIDQLIETEAHNINSQHFSTENPERIERIKLALNLLSSEFSKGAEIHPGLNAPPEVSELFSDFKNLLGVNPNVKGISNKNKEDQ